MYENRPPRWLVVLTILGLLGLSGFLRLYRLDEAPPGLYPDIAANGIDALHILQGQGSVFFPANNGREGMIMYWVAALIFFFGRTVLSLRLPAALASTATVLALFWLGHVLAQRVAWEGRGQVRLYPTWQGWVIGATAAGLLAVALGPITLGRDGWRANLLPLFLCVSIGAIWNGVQQRSWRWIGLAGLSSGLLFYTYLAARVYPLLLLLLAITFLPTFLAKFFSSSHPNEVHQNEANQNETRQIAKYLLGFVLITLLVASPLIGYFVLHPDQLTVRSSALRVINPSHSIVDNLQAVRQNVWDHLAVFGWHGDPNVRHIYQSLPWLNPMEAFCFWLGVGLLCWQWRKPFARLLLLWWAVLLIPAVLARDTPPNTLRMIGTLPAVYLIIGFGLSALLRLPERFLQHSPRLRLWLGRAAMLLFAFYLVLQGRQTYQRYFDQWLLDPKTYTAHLGEWRSLSEEINAKSADSGEVYLVPLGSQFPLGYQMYSFEYLYTGTLPAHLFKMSEEDAPSQVYQALRQDQLHSPIQQINLVDWTFGEHWSADGTKRLRFLLNKYAQPQEAAHDTNYDVYPFDQVDLSRPWELYRVIEPLEVAYDGHISLRGVALGVHGGEQYALHVPVQLTRQALAHPLWLVCIWRADQAIPVDYRVSIRLHDSNGVMVFQNDQDLRNSDHRTTTEWGNQAIVESLHSLALPNSLPADFYQLRVVVYDSKTLVPTVQIGVWQPEYTLGLLIID